MTLLSSLPAVQYLDDTDPYHYTVDNRPLLNLANRDEAIANAFDAALPSIGSASFNFPVYNINFNATGDTAFTFTLPTGYTNWFLNNIWVAGTSGTFTTARMGVYSAPSQGGTVLANQQDLSSITSVATNVAQNVLNLTVANASVVVYSYTTLYINVGTAQGGTSVGNVILSIRPLF